MAKKMKETGIYKMGPVQMKQPGTMSPREQFLKDHPDMTDMMPKKKMKGKKKIGGLGKPQQYP